MKQAIAGVAPTELCETTVMTVWPSMAGSGLGCWIGRMCSSPIGFGSFFTLGKLAALALIPLALALYAKGLMPILCRRYRLTNRRVIVERGLTAREDSCVALDDFDTIDVIVRPGQEWYPAGDLIFRRGSLETLRLNGVLRPETFRRTCLKSRSSFVGVQQALARAEA